MMTFFNSAKRKMTIVILLIVAGASAFFVFGKPPEDTTTGSEVLVAATPPSGSHDSLQLKKLVLITVTPTPTPTPAPSPTPTLSPTPACTDVVAIDLLIDTSKSMEGSKMTALKSALKSFAGKLTDESLIAMQTFSDTVIEQVPFSKYKDVKTTVDSVINGLAANGGTSTRDGFNAAKQSLSAAKTQYPNYKFALVFLSDGIPQTLATNLICPGGQNGPFCRPFPGGHPQDCECFDVNQDPTTAPSVSDAIKNLGVTIYSIALLDPSDTFFNSRQQTLFKTVASAPEDYFDTFNESDLKQIFDNISTQVCQ